MNRSAASVATLILGQRDKNNLKTKTETRQHSKPGIATIALLVLLAMLAPLAIDMYLPALEMIKNDFSAADEGVTATVSIFFAGLAIGQLFFGPWSDRVGRRVLLLFGLLAFLVGSLVAAFSPNILFLLVGRLLQALGGSAVMVSGRALVRDLYDERDAAHFFSTIALFGGLAPVFAPAIGAGILTIGSWPVIFMSLAGLATLLLLFVYRSLPESRSAETEAKARNAHPFLAYYDLLRDRRMVGYLLAGGFNSGAFYTYIAIAPLVFMVAYDLSPGMYSLIVAINSVGLVGAAQINRMLLKHRTPAQILSGAKYRSLALAAGFIIFALYGSGALAVLLVLLFLIVSSHTLIQANCMASALSVDPHRAGAAAALFGAASFGLGTAFSFVGGLVFDGAAGPVMWVMAIALLGSAAAIWLTTIAAQKGRSTRSEC